MADSVLYDMADTWNDGGTTFTSMKLTVTDTASDGGSLLLDLLVGVTSRFKVTKAGHGILYAGLLVNSGVSGLQVNYYNTGLIFGSGMPVSWTNAGPDGVIDLTLSRVGAGIFSVANPAVAGAAVELTEMTAPAAGAANTVRLFSKDNGSGKTQLMALFATGAAQQVAIEP